MWRSKLLPFQLRQYWCCYFSRLGLWRGVSATSCSAFRVRSARARSSMPSLIRLNSGPEPSPRPPSTRPRYVEVSGSRGEPGWRLISFQKLKRSRGEPTDRLTYQNSFGGPKSPARTGCRQHCHMRARETSLVTSILIRRYPMQVQDCENPPFSQFVLRSCSCQKEVTDQTRSLANWAGMNTGSCGPALVGAAYRQMRFCAGFCSPRLRQSRRQRRR
jgi:hypothetical protein